MDPNAALQELREAARELDAAFGDEDLVVTVLDHIRALDGWLCGGGFPPLVWDRALMGRTASRSFNVNGSITSTNGTGWTSTRTTPTVVIDSAIQGALTAEAAIDIFIELVKSTHHIDDSDLELSVVATDRESDAVATRELRLTF